MREETFTKEITIRGETRLVTFLRHHLDASQYNPARVTTARSIDVMGNYSKGGKVWKKELTLTPEGVLLQSTVILNRNGYRLIGFNNDDNNSLHNSAR